jgi:hypothetical protein
MWNAIKWVLSTIAAVLLIALVLAAIVGIVVFGAIGGLIVFIGIVVLLLAKEVKDLLDR